MFGGSKLQASGLQNGPFATAKQHLIACRNRAQTYPQKLPNAPSECQEKIYLFCLLQLLFGGSKLQASGFQKGPFATAKQHLIACRSRAQTYPQKVPIVPSEFLEKISFSVSCSCCLVAPSCKHQASRCNRMYITQHVYYIWYNRCVYIYTHTLRTNIYTYMYMIQYVYIYICIWYNMFLCIYIYVCMYIYIYMLIHIYIYMLIHIYIYVYVYVYVYTRTCIYTPLYLCRQTYFSSFDP